MMGAAQRWTTTVLSSLTMLAVASVAPSVAPADDHVAVSDADRLSENFTREAATVGEGQLRLEVRALRVEERSDGGKPDCSSPFRKKCARVNLIGQRLIGVDEVKGTTMELITSYGLAEDAEIGLIIPGYVETIRLDSGGSVTNEDLGDLTLYGKFTHAIADNFNIGGGVELTMPPWNGLDDKARTMGDRPVEDENGDEIISAETIAKRNQTGFSTGELGINPFLSGRYSMGRVALGAHAGYTFYTGDEIEEVFNYSASALVRGGESYALRLELNGRVWDEFGEKWHDLVLMPGVDYALSDNAVFRPTGLMGITGTGMDWGVGAGVAVTF